MCSDFVMEEVVVHPLFSAIPSLCWQREKICLCESSAGISLILLCVRMSTALEFATSLGVILFADIEENAE